MHAAMGASLVTILAATIAGWIFGAVYYGILAKQWMKAAGLNAGDINGQNGKPGLMPYLISIVCEFIMAYVLAVLLLHTSSGEFSLGDALASAFILWLAFILTTQMVNHRYSMKPWTLTIIDSGHWLGVLIIQAVVIALMGL